MIGVMRASLFALVALAGCHHAAAPTGPKPISLDATIAEQAWYRAPTPCGQGPYELELPATESRWGEEVQLRLSSPRAIALHVVIVADDAEVGRIDGTFDRGGGPVQAPPENAKCVANAHEQLAATHAPAAPPPTAGSAAPPPSTATTFVPVPAATANIALVPDSAPPSASIEVLHFSWDGHGRKRVRVKLWSVDPNDLTNVRFGIARIEWRPNVSDADYETYLARRAAEQAARDNAPVPQESAADRQARLQRAERDRQHEADEERRRAIAAALEAQRAVARDHFCSTHDDDRDCWGAGGRRVHDDLARHDDERAAYCKTAPEDARCWSTEQFAVRRAAYHARVTAALAPPKQPEGPPPAPLAELPPPKLSQHAEWRPGYWQWTGTEWTWLGGMWRVPDSDIAAQLTTIAPSAPPPPRVETIAVAPMRTLVWIPGFWQWNGTAWVWISGSWQRAEPGATWRPAEWRDRDGKIHVLIPGAWVKP
jgi:hypothetical protein